MKVLNSFIKHAHLIIAACLSLGILSCSNEEENTSSSNNNSSPEVEVTKMSDWLPYTRIETAGNAFDANVDNFTSSRGKTVGRQAFKNIRVI